MRITVKLVPGAKVKKIEQITSSQYKVWLTEKPIEGKANDALIRTLADHFHIAKSEITIVQGAKNREKVVEITRPNLF